MYRKTETGDIKYNELLQKEKYLEVINAFATSLIEAETIEDIMWSVTRQAIAYLDYYDCVVYLYDDKKKVLVQRAAYGPKSPKDLEILNPLEIKPGTGIVGCVFESGIGEIVNDTSLDQRYLVDDASRFSEISIPLIHKGKVLGVLDSEHPNKNFFTDEDFKMLTTVAAMISTKLAQAKSNEQVRKYQINLEKLVQRKTRQLEDSNRDLISKNREKEILIKEIHHRVKNNMQIIISLLNMQANVATSERERAVFEESKDRIRSMALIHERLYLEKDILNISLEEYTRELVQELSASYRTEKPVEFKVSIDPVQISIDTAIPVGLMLNELITNALKHAFKRKGGCVEISSTHNPEQIMLIVKDNGPGFDYENYQGKSFGLELIDILASQLNGELSYLAKNGSVFTISFPYL
ncbi:MAG: GAF domain-containing protein [Bacteroidetes bacterium]|nr:GAF domain-containing protein [Bacteroidota bacterium]